MPSKPWWTLVLVAALLGAPALAQEGEGGGEGEPAAPAPAPETPPAPAEGESQFPATREGLKDLWKGVLATAKNGDEEAVRVALEKMVMTEADFKAILGDEKGAEVFVTYGERFAKLWPGEAKTIVEKVKQLGYDDAIVTEVSKDHSTAGEKRLLKALKEGTKVYTVRLSKKGVDKVRKYTSFVHVNGRWKTGLDLVKLAGGAAGEKGPEKEAPKEEKKDAPEGGGGEGS